MAHILRVQKSLGSLERKKAQLESLQPGSVSSVDACDLFSFLAGIALGAVNKPDQKSLARIQLCHASIEILCRTQPMSLNEKAFMRDQLEADFKRAKKASIEQKRNTAAYRGELTALMSYLIREQGKPFGIVATNLIGTSRVAAFPPTL